MSLTWTWLHKHLICLSFACCRGCQASSHCSLDVQLPRAAGALLLAPAADRGLSLLEKKLGLRSRQQVGIMSTLSLSLLLLCRDY